MNATLRVDSRGVNQRIGRRRCLRDEALLA
jgi:hypothetical protein